MVETALNRSVPDEALRTILKNQYHAAMAMLRQSIDLCPDEIWSGGDHTNHFWRIAYHVLYFTHLYLQPKLEAFTPWEHHQTDLQYLDNIPAPPEIEALVELPHRPPQTGEPYSKEEMLAYWTFCDEMIDSAIDALDLLDPESGFFWYKLSKLEHQVISLRHTQHHTAQLMDRVRAASDNGVDWVSSGRNAKQFVED
jgi:hypothetical protein